MTLKKLLHVKDFVQLISEGTSKILRQVPDHIMSYAFIPV